MSRFGTQGDFMRAHLTVALLAVLTAACGPKSADTDNADYAKRMAEQHRTDVPTPSPATQAQAAAPIKSQTVQYGTVNGKPVSGYLAYPADAEGGLPAVLMFHEWWGVNDNIKSMANQLAAQGYVALATDLYGGRVASDAKTAKGLMEQALADPDAMRQNLRQGHAYLKEQIKATRVGTIGWCFGGGVSLKAGAALGDQVDAVIVYYGHVSGDAESLKSLKAPLLGFFGGADEGIPVESVHAFESALKQLGKSEEIHIYEGASHAFANPSGGNYKADAADDAWQRSLIFLAEHLKGG
jgi:carboxymethylenebutenolidase